MRWIGLGENPLRRGFYSALESSSFVANGATYSTVLLTDYSLIIMLGYATVLLKRSPSMARSRETPSRSRGDVSDKRTALLDAALALFAREGLQNVSTAVIAETAGVASGTLFTYFETKQDLINELYLGVVDRRISAVTAAVDPTASTEANFRAYWFALARWHLDHPAASNVMVQFEASSALTPETQARKDEMEEEMVRSHFPNTDPERIEQKGSLYRHVVHAITAGPIRALAHMREKGGVEITDELLEQTFARVKRALISDKERPS